MKKGKAQNGRPFLLEMKKPEKTGKTGKDLPDEKLKWVKFSKATSAGPMIPKASSTASLIHLWEPKDAKATGKL